MKPKEKANMVKGMVRSVFVAPEGKKLFVADFAAIEDRTGMWYAQEEEILRAFEDKVDAYCITAAQIYGYEVQKKTHHLERMVGKVTRLGALYGMGVDTFFELNKHTLRDEDHAKECIKTYRSSHPGVQKVWKDVGYCFEQSIRGYTMSMHGLTFRPETIGPHEAVTIELPSGRKLIYYSPCIRNEFNENFGDYCDQIYVTIRGSGGMMERRTWGGDIFQDVNQATARDLCCYGTRAVEDLGFEPVISVHDECIAIGDEDREVSEFEAGFSKKPLWAIDIPLDVEGWKGKYYRKD